MKTLTLFLMLLATPVHAACSLEQFTPVPINNVCGINPRSWTQNGITISYGGVWTIDKERFAPGFACLDLQDLIATVAGWDGLFVAPDDDYALRRVYGEHLTEGSSEFYFSPPVKYFKIRYYGTHEDYTYNCTGLWPCPPGATCTCYLDRPLPVTFRFFKGYGQNDVVGSVVADEDGGTPWPEVEFSSPVAFNRVYIDPYDGPGYNSHLSPLFFDDLSVCTEQPPAPCPHPPCQFERARLVKQETVTPAQRTSWGQLKVLYR